jgi:hypothetical protein
LPPNSDEILVRFETLPTLRSRTFFQYQMMRHGVEYGPGMVDGSSLAVIDHNYSENRKKYFLHDGVYQWNHVVKAGGSYRLNNIPISLFGEFGVIITQFSETGADPGTEENLPYHFLGAPTAFYKPSVGVILTLGLRLFST